MRKNAAKYTIKECPVCGGVYSVNVARLKWNRGTSCSRECSYVLRGRNQWKEPMKRICRQCGRVDTISWSKQREMLCKSCVMTNRFSGERKTYSSMGYVYLYQPEHPLSNNIGYIAEHRVVMEEKLGEQIEPWNIVHHINYKKDDNRPENLWLFDCIEEHQKWHQWLYKRERL